MTPHEALSELIRRGTRNDESARHVIVLRLTGDDLNFLAAILRCDTEAPTTAKATEQER